MSSTRLRFVLGAAFVMSKRFREWVAELMRNIKLLARNLLKRIALTSKMLRYLGSGFVRTWIWKYYILAPYNRQYLELEWQNRQLAFNTILIRPGEDPIQARIKWKEKCQETKFSLTRSYSILKARYGSLFFQENQIDRLIMPPFST